MFRVKRTAARRRDPLVLAPADRELLEGMSDLVRQSRGVQTLPEGLVSRPRSPRGGDPESS